MSPDELAALSAAATVLDTGTAWKPSDFWDTDQDWQEALATAANAFPRLVAEVLRLRAGLKSLRRKDHVRADDGTWAVCQYECQCGADAQNARITALLAGAP